MAYGLGLLLRRCLQTPLVRAFMVFGHPPSSATLLFPKSDAVMYQIPREDKRKGPQMVLRPGMVLLKGFLTFPEQEFIVRDCRYLGLRRAGFYWAYEYTMQMCLGLDWDANTMKYSKMREFDQCQPSYIPPKFLAMMMRALIAAQDLIKGEDESTDVESVPPMMSHDICLVKFYNSPDRLGLCQVGLRQVLQC